MRQLRVLVACECSGRVRDAFAARGWEAWSADLLPSESPASWWPSEDRGGWAVHYQGDVRELFDWRYPVNEQRAMQATNEFFACKNTPGWQPSLPLWDLIIAHPPCDHLSYAGARWFRQKQADGRQTAAAEFFLEMVNAPSPLVAVENPHSIMQKLYQPPTQIVEPWQFGDPFVKKIHLWLKGLPELVPDSIVTPTGRITTGGGSWRTDKAAARSAMSAYEDSEGRANRAKVRSRTMPGLARAMAEQWGRFAEEYYA